MSNIKTIIIIQSKRSTSFRGFQSSTLKIYFSKLSDSIDFRSLILKNRIRVLIAKIVNDLWCRVFYFCLWFLYSCSLERMTDWAIRVHDNARVAFKRHVSSKISFLQVEVYIAYVLGWQGLVSDNSHHQGFAHSEVVIWKI